MRTELTDLVLIIDRSASMGGLEEATVNGINYLLEAQKSIDGELRVTTVLFDDRLELMHDRLNIEEISEIDRSDYYVRGCTALYDAISLSILKLANIHMKTLEKFLPFNVIVFIITDGNENCSKIYSEKKVKHIIRKYIDKFDWRIFYFGSTKDTIMQAERIGINRDRIAMYVNEPQGIKLNYLTICDIITQVRNGVQFNSYELLEKVREQYNLARIDNIY